MNAGLQKALAVLALCSPLAAEAADTLASIRERRAIIVAHRESSMPFSYLGENKRPIGYAIDICMRVVEAVKRELKLPQLEVQYLSVTPANRIAAITEGKADLECGSTTNTRDRRRLVDFSIPYFVASARMAVRTDSGIRNWPDLRDKKIVTTKGTTNAQTLIDRDKIRSLNIALVQSNDHAEAFSMVERREADAFAMDDVLLYSLRASAKRPDDFIVLGDSLSTEPYAIMLGKNDPAFKRIVDMEVARIMNQGEIYALYDKWFKRPIPPNGINMNMPMGQLLRSVVRFPGDKVGDL